MVFAYSAEWILMIYSLQSYQDLPILQYMTLSIAVDNLFTLIFSRRLLSRRTNAGHALAVLLGIIGIALSEVLFYEESPSSIQSKYHLH